MAIQVFVAGVDRSALVDGTQGIQWSDLVNGRGELSIRFTDEPGGFRPVDGQELLVVEPTDNPIVTSDGALILTSDGAEIQVGPTRHFGGNLVEPEERATPDFSYLHFDCVAQEFGAIGDRRLVARVYEQETLDAIVRDIVAQDLDGEGIGVTGVEPGPVIEKAVFNYWTVNQALDALAELTGRAHWVDYQRQMQFRERTSITAPAALDRSSLRNGTVVIRPDRSQYRNTQIVRAGTDMTDPRTETLVGDGERRVFALAFPIGAVPSITVSRGGGAFVDQTIGILGVETGRDWYWNVAHAQVSQDDAGTVLTAPSDSSDPSTGDRVRVIYRGQFPVIVQYEDGGEIASRKAIEGGSGIYARHDDHPELNSAASAIELATALISRHGRIGTIVIGETDVPGYAPGQLVPVDLPEHGIDDDYLIESVEASVPPGRDQVIYVVRAISGDPYGGWQAFFKKLQQKGRSLVLAREGEILVFVRVSAAPTLCSDEVTVQSAALESRIGFMEIGLGVIGAAA